MQIVPTRSVGNFMNHNTSAVVAIDPRVVNDSVYQKTLGINDFYLDDGRGGPPLGNIQLFGRVTAPILKASIGSAPEWSLRLGQPPPVDWYAMSEDLPNPESRVTVDGEQIRLDWKRSNWRTHETLVETVRGALARSGLSDRPFAPVRPPDAVASVRAPFASGPIRRRRRSIPSAAPGTIRISSWSTRRSCRRRLRSIRR